MEVEKMSKAKIQKQIDKINLSIENREEALYDVDHHEQEAILAEIREFEAEREELEFELELKSL